MKRPIENGIIFRIFFLNFAAVFALQVPGAVHLGCFEDTDNTEDTEDGGKKSFRILQGATPDDLDSIKSFDLDETNSPLK